MAAAVKLLGISCYGEYSALIKFRSSEKSFVSSQILNYEYTPENYSYKLVR